MKLFAVFVAVSVSSIGVTGCSSAPTAAPAAAGRAPASAETSLRLCENLRRMVLHSHRGAADRPENMLTAFHRAVDLGADVVEMDLQVSRDAKPRHSMLVVAHDHWLKEECVRADGQPQNGRVYYRDLTLAQIQSFDCGSKVKTGQPVPGEKISSLLQVLQSLDGRVTRKGQPLGFNIEIKYNPTLSPRYYPPRPEYVGLLLAALDEARIANDRILVQSFDIDVLRELRRQRPGIRLAALLPDIKVGMDVARELNLDLITPHISQVSPASLKEFHDRRIQVIPWTVNRPDEALRAIELGTDGVITDQPDLYVFAEKFCGPGAMVHQGPGARGL